MKTLKYIFSLLTAVILLTSLVSTSVCYGAMPDGAAKASLSVEYKSGDTAFMGLEIKIYNIARLNGHEEYSLTEEFASYPVKVYGVASQAEWKVIASTLSAYISADSVEPSFVGVTDEAGKVKFSDIPHGMYLVSAVRCETEEEYVSFDQFIAVVPRPDNGGYVYDVEAIPKYESFPKEGSETEFRLVKLWRDEGNESNRPESIRVELMRNGEHYKSVTLDSSNNWSFTWSAPADNSLWEAVERDVPDGYTVGVIRDGAYIAVTNSFDGGEITPPPTGDGISAPIAAAVLSLAGAILVLGAMKFRKREA